MTLREKIYFSEPIVKRFGRKALSWFHGLECGDERKITLISRKNVKIKAEIAQNTLTMTIHVCTKNNKPGIPDMWIYRKYIIFDTDRTISTKDDMTLDSWHGIRFTRSGKYAFADK